MAGLINTGIGYQNRALSGLLRQSEQEQQRERENARLSTMRDIQDTNTGAQLATLGGVTGYSMGGWSGAGIGAGVGWLFSKLF